MESNIYKSYLSEVRRYDLLTVEQEHSLARLVQQGDVEAKMTLVKSNLRLVASLAKRYASPRINIMDLIQEGNLGLMTAAAKYTCEFNTRFSTYAYAWILQYILRFIRNKSNAISLPHRKEELIRALRGANSYLEQQNGCSPTLKELSCYMGLPIDLVQKLYVYMQPVCSLDCECNDESDGTVGDMIADERYQPEDMYLKKEKKDCVHSLVAQLPQREKDIISKRYRFDGTKGPHTLRDLSKVMGVSSETVRQIEIRAINKLRTFVDNSEISALYRG